MIEQPRPAGGIVFPDWTDGRPDILFIAGEHSGDQHAARVARTILARHPDLRIAALGGPELKSAGARLLFDLTESSVVGLAEVLSSYRFFRKIFSLTADWIRMFRPRLICFVDYPGFNLRLARYLRDEGISRCGGGEIATHYYISPQIWAWKAGRRFEMAQTLDSLAVIFPFEVHCYRDTALDVTFVGHPFVESDFTSPVEEAADGAVLLLPGSRRQAVNRIFPVMAAGWERYKQMNGIAEQADVIYPDVGIRNLLENTINTSTGRDSDYMLSPAQTRMPHQGRAVLTSSGTMSLACALAGIPGVIVYRAHPMTYALGRMLVQVPFIGIANLLLPDMIVYPELIQDAATPMHIANALRQSMTSRRRVEAHQFAERLREKLTAPRYDAATWLLNALADTTG